MNKFFIFFLILLSSEYYVNSAKILGVFTAPGRSHYILGSSLMKGLAEKGHDVTVISPFGEKSSPNNYRDIVVTEIMELKKEMESTKQINLFERESVNPFISLPFVSQLMSRMQELTLKNKQVQELIHSDETFDVVIVEQFFNDAQKALATHFNAPLVILSSVGANYWINSVVGNPAPRSYIPDLALDSTVPLNFLERLKNSALYLWLETYFHLIFYPNQNEMIQKYIPNPPNIYDVIYNASLVLMNAHTSINQPVPYVPTMINIGGYHVQPSKKLPKDLQEYLDNAKDGVIYFSMGSNLKSADFPVEKRDAILKTFAKLKQKVLWKWEQDVLPGQPPNVKLSKWLPQQDILAHPNVKLFITHGGYLSTTETIYHGVPLLAIPIFGDQKMNAQIAVNKGYGLMLSYGELSEKTFTDNINEILNNPKYKNNAKQISQLFHDRMVHPMETAIYWIEYVIRHKGAPHLRVAALDLPWYQYHLLDVIVVLTLGVITTTFIFSYLIKKIFNKICSKSNTKKVKKN